MEDYILTQGKVVSIDDPDLKGKIKVKILPELQDVIDSDLPWAIPFTSFQGGTTLTNDLPEVDSIVRILVRKDWKRFYYLGNYFFEAKFNFSDIISVLAPTGSDTTYKNLIFRLYEDGGIRFHNNNSGDDGFVSKSGSYSIFKSNGDVVTHTGATNKIVTEGGTVEISSNTSLKISGLNIDISGVNGVGTLTSKGVAVPSGTGYFCAIPVCPMTGVPHTGETVTLLG